MNKTKAFVACGAIGVIGSLCLFTGYRVGKDSCIRQIQSAAQPDREGLAWLTRLIDQNPGIITEWFTIAVHKGTNAPYWTIRGGRPLNQQQFEQFIAKLHQNDIGQVFLYGEEDATVRQVEQTLDLLRAHSISNVLLFARVQGVVAPPFEFPDELKKE